MIICQCTGTTDRDIHRLRETGLDSVAAIARTTGAGRHCAPCRMEITRLLTLSSAPEQDATCAA
jgi:bacterioferritin-associated ferredoxin